MTDDLTTRLRTAGDLLDERGAQKLDDAVDGEARILTIAPITAARRQRGQRVLAAAAVVLVMALVAAVTWSSGTEEIGVAAGGETVAFVPSDGLGDWATLEVGQYEIEPMAYESVVLVPADHADTDRMVGAATVTVMPSAWPEPMDSHPNEPTLSGSGLDGVLDLESGPRATLMTLPLAGADGLVDIQVNARSDTPVDEMFALAALVDPLRPLGEQTFEGWEAVAGYDTSLAGGVARTFTVTDDGPSGQVDRWMWTTTATGVDDTAMWVLHEPYNADITQVRGKEAWISLEEGMATVTWVEAPGTVVQLTYGSSVEGEDQVERALAAVEDLVPADQDAWEQFADQATVDNSIVPTTEEPRLPPPLPDEAADADEVISGRLAIGWFHVWIDQEAGHLCWEIHRDSSGEAACEYLASPGTPQPVVTDDGVLHLIAGIMPEGAEFVEVSTDQESIDLDVSGVLWVAPVPPGQTLETVIFLDADRQPLESIDSGTGAGGAPPA